MAKRDRFVDGGLPAPGREAGALRTGLSVTLGLFLFPLSGAFRTFLHRGFDSRERQGELGEGRPVPDMRIIEAQFPTSHGVHRHADMSGEGHAGASRRFSQFGHVVSSPDVALYAVFLIGYVCVCHLARLSTR